MKFRNLAMLAIAIAFAAAFPTTSRTATADEPTAKFLEALRKAGYQDVVGFYFDSLEMKKGLSPELRKSIPYEKAVALIRFSRSMRDSEQRRSTLSQAEKLLASFVKANPSHKKKNEAIFEQAAATRERGKVDLDIALFSNSSSRKPQLMSSARPLFDRANKLFLSAITLLQAELKKYPASIDRKTKPEYYAERETVRRKLHDAMYFEAVTLFDFARTFNSKDARFKPAMDKAAASFKTISELHRMTPNGFRSKFMQGRCYQMTGQFRSAKPVYKELTELNGKSDFVNNIRNQAKYYQLQIWNDDREKEYKLVEDAAAKWLNAPENRDEARARVGLRIRFQRAFAFEQRSLQKTTTDRESKRILKLAQDDAQLVSQQLNLHQNEAVMMVVRIRQKLGIAASEPKKFIDAYAQAKTRFQIVNEKISDLKVARVSNKTPQELQTLEDDLEKSLNQAVRLLELAVELSTPVVKLVELDDVRYRLSYLYFYEKRYYEAAVLAEGVALSMKLSTPAKAPDAAFIAMSAYINLYNLAQPLQRTFETKQVKNIANTILANWPNSDRAGEAVAQLAQIHEISGERMEANEWFAKIPDTSNGFGSAQIRIGKNLLFYLYQLDDFNQNRELISKHLASMKGKVLEDILVGLKTISANDAAKKKPYELSTLLSNWLKSKQDKNLPESIRTIQKLGLNVAQNYFETGLKAISKDLDATDLTPPELLDAKTALAQLKLTQNAFLEAVKLLSEEPHSPLKAIEVPDESKRPDDNSVKGSTYAQTVYQLLIQAYISAGETDKAADMLKRLEKLFEFSDQSKLVEMFEGIARSLQEDIQRLKKQGDLNLLETRVQTLERFLDGLYEKRSTLSYSSLLWIATTFTGLGEGMGDGGEKYYARAADTYAELLKKPNLDDDRILAVNLRLIDCRRLQKDFAGAVLAVGIILKERPNLLVAQLSSPKIFEDWGKSGKPEAFRTAINGDDKNGIWGWGKVANRLQRKMESDDISLEKAREYFQKFYNARYRMSWCRMEYGKAVSSDANNSERRSILGNAKTEIDSLALISGVLDTKIKSRFDDLYRQIQLAQNPSRTTFPSIDWPSAVIPLVDNKQPTKTKVNSNTENKTGLASKTESTSKAKEAEGSLSTILTIAIFVGGGGLVCWFIFSMQKHEKKRRRMLASANAADDTPFDFEAMKAAQTSQTTCRRKSQKVSSAPRQQRSGEAGQSPRQRPAVRKKPKDPGSP